MLDGRVKTLHPMVHGGLLARRDTPEHMAAIKEHGIEAIDMLVINLYPFQKTVAQQTCSFEDAIENKAKLEIYNMEKNLGILSSIARIAPMFGFIGTIIGVIEIFYKIIQYLYYFTSNHVK